MQCIKKIGWESLMVEAMAPEPYGPAFDEADILRAGSMGIWTPDDGWGPLLDVSSLEP